MGTGRFGGTMRGRRRMRELWGRSVRPRLVVFDHCKHIRMEGVTVQNSGFWQIVPYYADDVMFRNMRILAPQRSPNTDAIDPFSSSNMVIDHVLCECGR